MIAAACLVIFFDRGGSFLERREAVNNAPCTVIVGYCASACTMHLGAENVCVVRNATLGFHSPSGSSSASIAYMRLAVAEHYPEALREWYLSGPAYKDEMTYLDAAELNQMGVPFCRTEG